LRFRVTFRIIISLPLFLGGALRLVSTALSVSFRIFISGSRLLFGTARLRSYRFFFEILGFNDWNDLSLNVGKVRLGPVQVPLEDLDIVLPLLVLTHFFIRDLLIFFFLLPTFLALLAFL